MKKLSLRLRLICVISVMTLFAWGFATTIGFYQTRDAIREVFDTQLLLFAKRIASTNLNDLSFNEEGQAKTLPRVKSRSVKRHMFIEDDALTFAVFSLDGKMVLTDGEDSEKFVFNPDILHTRGNAIITKDKKWRTLWMLSENGQFVVAVGQEREYVNEVVSDVVKEQILPWLVMLPLLMGLIAWMITRELRPLKVLASELEKRKADDSTPIDVDQVAKEIRPFIKALNTLFVRVSEMLTKERRFTSNAAHELRTPLAALKIQAEVAQIAGDDVPMRENALNNLTVGIDRATRLVDQMLVLSRLDSLAQLAEKEPVNWDSVIQTNLHDLSYVAEQKHIVLDYQLVEEPEPIMGQPVILSLLTRNLIDNAIRYTPENGQVTIVLEKTKLIVRDNGQGIDEETLKRLGERFYRPPGQEQTGSGLGLSIVKQIAHLHGFSVLFANAQTGGFEVTVNWS